MQYSEIILIALRSVRSGPVQDVVLTGDDVDLGG